MSSSDSVTRWIRSLQEGEPEAARPLYERYFDRLIRLAHSRLQGVPLQAAGAEDVAAHAFESFCLRLERGDFTQLQDRDDLWRLLARIVVNKAGKLRRYHQAARRPKLVQECDLADPVSDSAPGLDREAGKEGSPDLLAEAADELQRVLNSLNDETLTQIVRWKLEGRTTQEIAEELGVVPRTIDRKLERIRVLWLAEEEDT
jgi:RNA polymerase sigma factor (sigma-70 family)